MDSLLTAAQIRLRDEARAAAEEIAAPGAVERDASCAFPSAALRLLGERGYMGLRMDPSCGGLGLDAVSTLLVITEISRACASIGLLAGFHSLVVGPLVAKRGRPELCETWIRRLAGGGAIGALAMTDPPPSAVDASPAHAFVEGDHLVLHGEKRFVPGAVGADLLLLYARWSDCPTGGGRRRVLLLVPRDTVGLADWGRRSDLRSPRRRGRDGSIQRLPSFDVAPSGRSGGCAIPRG